MNRVLGAHPQAITLGSVKKLPVILKKNAACCCGAASLAECPFWGEVDSELRKRGKRLSTIDIASADHDRFIEDNRDLYNAVLRVSGASVIVESSRRSGRLRRLRTIPEMQIIPIHLYKTPMGQAGSWKRKGKGLIQFVPDYLARNMRIMAACRNDPQTVMLSYEQFCREPQQELRRLLGAAGLAYDESILSTWGEAPIHTLGGNRMKRSTSSEIVLDEGWKQRLSALDMWVMQRAGGRIWRRMEARRTNH